MVAGYWILDTGCWLLDTSYWILYADSCSGYLTRYVTIHYNNLKARHNWVMY